MEQENATGILDIDHLMVSVADSAAAGDTFERMGFAPTPRSVLPGMSNRLVCFPDPRSNVCNFFELMALDDAEAAPPIMLDILRPAGRPVSMVMAAGDARATDAALRQRDVAINATMDFERDWTLPSGDVISPAFAVSIPEVGQFPFYWNVCQHKTAELYKLPAFVGHPNGASRLTAVIACAADPAMVAAAYARVWPGQVDTVTSGQARLTVGEVDLVIHDPNSLAANYPGIAPPAPPVLIGLAVAVPDVAAQADRLLSAGFTVTADDVRCYANPAETEGCLTVFVPA